MPQIELSEQAKTTLKQLKIDTTSTDKLSGSMDVTSFSALLEANILNCSLESFKGGAALEYVFLINNRLTRFPIMYTMPKLEVIQINDDPVICGPIPGLDLNTRLEKFTTPDLKLNGSIPNLLNCKNLTHFQVQNNLLTGSFPNISTLSALQFFNIADNNNIEGSITLYPANTALIDVALHNNNLSGPIPDLSAFTNLKFFRTFGNNNIAGPMPALSGEMIVFDARNNSLSGVLPPLGATPNMEFYVGAKFDGLIEGPLPPFSAAPNLKNFEFSYNKMSGLVPALCANPLLENLNIDGMALSGHFPHLRENVQLRALRFANNKKLGSPGITGDLPSLSACVNLKVLDVATNSLTGYAGGPMPSTLNFVQLQNNNLTQAAVNQILADLNALGTSNKICNIGGTNALPAGGDANADVVALRDRNWIVTII